MLGKLCKCDRKIACINKQVEALTSQKGVAVASDVQEEIAQGIETGSMEVESLPTSDFRRISGSSKYNFNLLFMCTIHICFIRRWLLGK